MPSIGILDDRKGQRQTIERVMNSTLKSLGHSDHWRIVSDEPPPSERDVIHWLDEHDATVLMTDWKLNEGSAGNRVVTYEADRIIHEIRSKRPNFPIFVITGFESEARAHLKDVENIFSRQHFAKNAAVVVPQMIRAGLRRHEEQRELLTKMDHLARRVASGKATKKDRTELQSLQGYFQAEVSAILNLDTALDQLESAMTRAAKLKKKVEARVARQDRN